MSAPGDSGTSRVTTSVRVSLGTPSVYTPQRKYAPVVAPKPKLNPYRVTGTQARPGPAQGLGAGAGAGTAPTSSRARLGKVGEIPDPSHTEDLPPPPPPAADEEVLPAPGFIPPPPPPPPFEDSFPPPPLDDPFPSPPSPMVQEPAPAAAAGSDTPAPAEETTLESEIDTLNSLLSDLERNDPHRPKVLHSGPTVPAQTGATPGRGAPPSAAPPHQPPASNTSGPRAPGFQPVRAPKPQVPLPKAQTRPGTVGPRPLGPVSAATGPPPGSRGDPGAPVGKRGPAGEAPVLVSMPGPSRDEQGAQGRGGEGGLRKQAGQGPTAQAQAAPERRGQEEGPPKQRETHPIELTQPSAGVGDATPLSYRDVQELEDLARHFIQEMDKLPQEKAEAAERCGVCGKELSRTQAAVKATGKLYHVECFVCSKCRTQLQGQQFYEVDGWPLCEACHQDTLEKCSACQQPITDRMLRATGKAFHPACFRCSVCAQPLEGEPFIVDIQGAVHCVKDYHRRYAPRCSVCEEPIVPEAGKEETVRIIALDKNFHVRCYRCEDCKTPLSTDADEKGCYPLEGHVLCLKCHTARVSRAGQKD